MRALLVCLMLLLPGLAEATTYWAKPTGTHDITGSSTFCNTIRSTDTSHVSQSRTSIPATLGTVGAAVACAKVAGDVVNISGIDGIYDGAVSGDNHRIDTSRTTVTPSFGLASGTAGNPTIVQTVPGDPNAELRSRNGASAIATYIGSATRSYVTFRRLKINGVNSDASNGNSDIGCIAPYGDHMTLEDSELLNCYAHGVDVHVDSSTLAGCLANHHLTVQRTHIHHTGLIRGGGYSMYVDVQDLVVDGNEMDNATGEFLQIYADTSPTNSCDAARPIVKNSYFHDLLVGTNPANQNYTICGSGMVFNGSDVQVYNNTIAIGCANTAPTGGIAGGIYIGQPHCVTTPAASNGRGFIWNNLIIGRSGGSTAGITIGPCVITSGSEVKNNVVLNYSTAIGGTQIGTAIVAANRTTGVVTDCFVSSTDLHLKTGTNPCVDAGTTVSAVTTDYEGTVRPVGAAYDIGPDELGSVTPPPDTTAPAPPSGVTIQ